MLRCFDGFFEVLGTLWKCLAQILTGESCIAGSQLYGVQIILYSTWVAILGHRQTGGELSTPLGLGRNWETVTPLLIRSNRHIIRTTAPDLLSPAAGSVARKTDAGRVNSIGTSP